MRFTQARMIAAVVYNLRAPGLRHDEQPETLEMLRMAFKPATRRDLQEAAKRSGITVLFSDPNEPEGWPTSAKYLIE